MFRLLLLGLFVTLGASVSIDDCPSGIEKSKYLKAFGTSCYRFELKNLKDFEDAEEDCERDAGGKLVKVTSQAVDDFLFSQLNSTNLNYQKPVWIGLNDMGEDNEFFWMDGSYFDPEAYDNFGPQEGPRSSFIQDKLDDCVAMDPKEGFWRDYYCNNIGPLYNARKAYVCENMIE